MQPFFRINSSPKIMSPVFNLYKFQKCEKDIPESCRMHWNLMNDEVFGSLKLLKLKYRRGDQLIQLFWKIGSPPKKLGPPSSFGGNLKNLEKIILNHAECFEI